MNKPLIISIVVAALLFFGGLFVLSRIGAGELVQNAKLPSSVAQLSFERQNGEGIIALADFSGKPLVINTWATWCPFCVQELSEFDRVQQEFGNEVVIIAVNRFESRSQAQNFTEGLGLDNVLFLLDSGDNFYQNIGGFSMPETLFINAAGEIIHHKRGPMQIAEIRDKIQDIL